MNMIKRMSSIVEELVETTYRILRRVGGKVSIIEYPRSSSKAIDIVSRTSSGKKLFLRITSDTENLGKADIVELKASSRIYNASPLIVAYSSKGYEVEDDVVYEKHGVYVVSVQGLKNIIEEKEPIYIYNYRGVYVVKINPKKLREKREELGLSLGDLASLLGVSRKTIYEYERGSMNLSIEKAARLLELFGEEVFEPVNIFEYTEETRDGIESGLKEPDNRIEQELLNCLKELGYNVVHLRKTPVDIVGSHSRRDIVSIVVRHYSSRRRFRSKVYEADKIVEITGSKEFVIEKEEDLRAFLNSVETV